MNSNVLCSVFHYHMLQECAIGIKEDSQPSSIMFTYVIWKFFS